MRWMRLWWFVENFVDALAIYDVKKAWSFARRMDVVIGETLEGDK